MGKQLTKLRRRKEAKRELDALDERRDQTLVIHYSCESFYDVKDGKTPRVTSIAIRNFATGQTTSFSIHKSAEQSGVPILEITKHYDKLERKMLDEFFAYVPTVPVQTFVHWNMRDVNYGFQAIEHRYKALGGKPIIVPDSRKFDLARALVSVFGIGYVPHGQDGRMFSTMELNSITARDALKGREEAQAFEDGQFVRLHQSTLRKVDVIANILERTLDGTLKTTATWREQHGFHPAAVVEFVKEHWVWTLVTMVAVLIGLVARFVGT
ncbi:MAG: hypothetical protein WBL74_02780 [Novosphingobium sp.]|uniref:hypothetical protein n=1 Tax=Novosphingobium sp. TaxID=1874826 RepID=UPI003C7D978C